MHRQIALLENDSQLHLFPFTLTRSVADLRIGLFTIREKWALALGRPVEVMTAAQGPKANLPAIPANLVPTDPLPDGAGIPDSWLAQQPRLERPWQMPRLNREAIEHDIALVRSTRTSVTLPSHVRVINPEQVFVEAGARIEHCILNASEGPIYIGREALVMDGAMIRGPVAVCEGAVVKMGAMVYGATTIGPYSVVGGEVKNSILMGFCNKAHEGYLGDAVIGEWCNLGAGTSCSNLKNSARPVEVWNAHLQAWESAGPKCGLIMGDFSRSAINTAFNTGTVTGVCCNIFGDGTLTPKYIPSFSWGTHTGQRYELTRVMEDIRTWMGFKNRELDPNMEQLIQKIHSLQ
jgi:UDP-N-acetylglucosamine diphosphorylase/glucosamine-1-phosphate N-acetyltransferase